MIGFFHGNGRELWTGAAVWATLHSPMQRSLQPELLDSLAPDDPAARHNRRDLRRINRLLGTAGWFARELSRRSRPGEAVLELGAGTGELGMALAARGLAGDGLDLWPRPAGWPKGRAWHRADLRDFSGYPRYGAVFGNLILHQFGDAELAALGQRLAQGPWLLLFSEPARRRRFQILCRIFLPLLGANFVSRHDAHVSIAGGFLGAELPRALGLNPAEWSWHCSDTGRGAYRMIAWRRA
jgi:hypothetical protein